MVLLRDPPENTQGTDEAGRPDGRDRLCDVARAPRRLRAPRLLRLGHVVGGACVPRLWRDLLIERRALA